MKWTLRVSPMLATMVGPGTLEAPLPPGESSLYAHTVVSTPGRYCQVVTVGAQVDLDDARVGIDVDGDRRIEPLSRRRQRQEQ